MSTVAAKSSIFFETDLVKELREKFRGELGSNLRTYTKCLEYLHMLVSTSFYVKK